MAHDIEELRALALAGDAAALDELLELVRLAEFAETQRTGEFHFTPHVPTERDELHAELDAVYDRLWRWEMEHRLILLDRPKPDPAKSLEEAHHIYTAALSLATKLTRTARPMIAPAYSQGDPVDMRRALAELLNLVHPVLPHRSKSIGPGWPEATTIWTDDLLRWLGMLDEGATPDIFKPNTQKTPGNRKSDWASKRYRGLMAMWCLHLRQSRTPKAANEVVIAFGKPARSGEAISRDMRALIKAAQSAQPVFGLSEYAIKMAVTIAWEPADAGSIEHSIRSKSFWRLTFGPDDPRGTPSTLAETGQRYRDFMASGK